MENVKFGLILTLHGIKDCLCGIIISLKLFLSKESNSNPINAHRHSSDNQGSVYDILLQCLRFGVLFWIPVLIFNHYLMTSFLRNLAIWFGEDINSAHLYYVEHIVYGIFCVGWILPLLIVSKILNYNWYQDIAELTFRKAGIKRNTTPGISEHLADQIKSSFLQLCYCFQGYAVYFLPLPIFVQYLWYLFHMSLLFSLYAFEYKWVQIGWSLQRRLLYIDTKWPYFFGFGLPLAAVTTYIPSFIDSMIVFATLFPVYVISSTVTFDAQSQAFKSPIHSFRIVDSITDAGVSFAMRILYR